MKKHKIVVLGGGTAGMMAATYIKSYWADQVQVVVVYDHKNPGIGVGESLTPIFVDFLKAVDVSVEELIRECNATFKLGLKFKNWRNDGSYYYHTFIQLLNNPDNFNYVLAASVAKSHDKIFTNEEYNYYDSFYFENSKIPFNENSILGNYSFHIDATLFSDFLKEKFKSSLIVKDNVVIDVEKDDNGFITNLICQDGQKISGDFFIDASGFQRVLFKHLENNTWIDKKDWLPLDRCIPNPVFCEFKEQPTYTTSEASDDGWILQVPLQNRWGSGYLYSSNFTTDEKAFEKFSAFVQDRYDSELNNTSRVLKFDSGYWDQQWIKNCLSIGLSCGFSEPLEATNIHQVVHQLSHFIQMYNFKINQHDVDYYNKISKVFFDNIYLYLRFCYCNDRTDTEFWDYMTNNEPNEIRYLKEKISNEVVNGYNLNWGSPFNYENFTLVANGLGLIDKDKYATIIRNRNILSESRSANQEISNFKSYIRSEYSIDHLSLIKKIRSDPEMFVNYYGSPANRKR